MSTSPPAFRLRRGPLRLLDRHRRTVAAVLTALAVVCAILVMRPPPQPRAEVLVAARDLDASAPLSEDDLTPLFLAESSVPDGALSPADRAAGLSLNAPVRRGEVLTDARLSDPPALPYGADMVAVPVRVADPGAVGLLSPGSRVDVLAATGADDFGGPPTRPGPAVEVVGDRPVLAVPPEEGPSGEGGALVLIAATSEEARALAGHATSSRLSVTIRG
ncbi:SAF domain-containing protein [Nocardiopsis sp. L17-MgMaSL7]|uniref:SAF domain-containing protein n=1 Tax=Nocardiopsis sp. L17-MgMaSL7 TaxID=1938893 RepID=UPI000D7099B9|nr:SAF domain-containing protein [Nocardiopsis sp. L17-MgMaSL7]PWV52169.1 Flp pilus assembly protein CpaB [Nocardiopsis sp. L17-MgMaSL7]